MCHFEGCDRDDRYGGFCNTHYHQQRRTGEMWPIGSARSLSRTKGARQAEQCGHEGCDGDPTALGYCRRHYSQFLRTGETWDGWRREVPMPPCSLDGCEDPQRIARGGIKPGVTGLCPKHAQSNARNLRDYGISLLDRQEMERRQDHRCAICKKPKKLHLDHCHKTGKVRGLLCHSCNTLIGLSYDSQEVLRAAVRYLDGRG